MYRIINFAKETNPTCYVVHMTIREGVDITRKAWELGVNMHSETCPQYLTRTRFNVDRILGKVNPPLRAEEDNEALWEGIRQGVVNYVGTDHAPCTKAHKEEFWSAVVGMSGIETFLPAMVSEGVNKGRITWPRLVEVCSANTSKLFGFTSKGLLSTGFDADVVIVDADKEVTVTNDTLHHIGDFTPFEGMTLKGWPILTMVRGEVVFENGKIVGKLGTGKFLRRSC
jgi:dihydroorotase-like cyclic amidohydrolase